MNSRNQPPSQTLKHASALFHNCPQLVAPVVAILAAVISAPAVALVGSQLHA